MAGELADDDYSVFLGHGAGKEGGSGVFIGHDAGVNTTLTKSNALFVANESGNRPLLYGRFDLNKLTTYGDLDVLSEGTGQDVTLQLRSTSLRPVLSFTNGGTSIGDGMSIEYDGSNNLSDKQLHINDRFASPIFTFEEGAGAGRGSAEVNGKMITDNGDVFLTNLGNNDTNQGIKWGETTNEVFGMTYDGEGSTTENRIHIQEYVSGGPGKIMTIKANGNVGIGTQNPQVEMDIDGTLWLRKQTLSTSACNSTAEYGKLAFDTVTNKLAVCADIGVAPGDQPGWFFLH
jgi:hypothetical protein